MCATQVLEAFPGAIGNCLRVLEASGYVQSFIQLINQSIKSFIQIKKHTTVFRLNYLIIYHCIPWGFVPFCNCPWVERILVVIPNGCWLCVRVQYSTERIEYEWPADCSFASSWETSLYDILYSIDRCDMIRLLSSVFHFRLKTFWLRYLCGRSDKTVP